MHCRERDGDACFCGDGKVSGWSVYRDWLIDGACGGRDGRV